jgi:hypothetical protein
MNCHGGSSRYGLKSLINPELQGIREKVGCLAGGLCWVLSAWKEVKDGLSYAKSRFTWPWGAYKKCCKRDGLGSDGRLGRVVMGAIELLQAPASHIPRYVRLLRCQNNFSGKCMHLKIGRGVGYGFWIVCRNQLHGSRARVTRRTL